MMILGRSILAGIAISVGGIAFLKVGEIAGAVLFTVGLLAVTHYKWDLYTGKAGFWPQSVPANLLYLLQVLGGNIAGCLIAGLAMTHASPEIVAGAVRIVEARVARDWLTLIILGTGCGFLMSVAVVHARNEHFLPLLFAVPAFILCGFAHSIADGFYISTAMLTTGLRPDIILAWVLVVLGNFIGCNLHNIAGIHR